MKPASRSSRGVDSSSPECQPTTQYPRRCRTEPPALGHTRRRAIALKIETRGLVDTPFRVGPRNQVFATCNDTGVDDGWIPFQMRMKEAERQLSAKDGGKNEAFGSPVSDISDLTVDDSIQTPRSFYRKNLLLSVWSFCLQSFGGRPKVPEK